MAARCNPPCTPASRRLAEMIRTKQVSAVEVMRATLARAEAAQATFNCFITLCAKARRAMRRPPTRRSPRRRPRAGSMACRSTSRIWSTRQGVRTTFALLMSRAQRAGAATPSRSRACVRPARSLIGKTTTPEFGTCPTRKLRCSAARATSGVRSGTCGGSSGGAAVAIAAGVAPLAVATDAGGSTRIPAACNGVVGFKQSARPHSARHVARAVRQRLEHQSHDAYRRRLRLDAGDHGRRAPPAILTSYGAAGAGLHRRRPARRRLARAARRLASADRRTVSSTERCSIFARRAAMTFERARRQRGADGR